MEKKLLDNMLEIIRINDNKKNILNNMLKLELEDKTDSLEYINYIDFYKRLSSNLINTINKLDTRERLIIGREICRLNPIIYQPINLKDTITNTDKFIVLKKTLVDLGSNFMILYQDDEEELLKKERVREEMEYCYSMYGYSPDIEETLIDSDLVNHYMVSDFTNVLYSQINNTLNNEISKDKKLELLKLKYNTIFLVPNIESRALQTSFLIPNTPRLTDKHSIIDTGIVYKDYVNKLDSVMVKYLEDSINISNPNDTIDLIFIKTYASILNDTELFDLIQIDNNTINDVLKQSRILSKNNSILRSYNRI